MCSEVKATMWQLLNEFDVVVEKILQRMKQEFQPKEIDYSNFLFHMNVERRQVILILRL